MRYNCTAVTLDNDTNQDASPFQSCLEFHLISSFLCKITATQFYGTCYTPLVAIDIEPFTESILDVHQYE